jgi:hypothetical protein
VLSVPLGEAEERLVAGVLRKGVGEHMSLCEVDAKGAESLEERGVVRVEEVLEINSMRICAPIEKEVEKVPPSSTECEIERAAFFKIGLVPIAEEE